MDLKPEIIEIGSTNVNNNVQSIQLNKVSNNDSNTPSMNFGGGIELLMNTKKIEKKNGGSSSKSKNDSDIDLNDLNSLEKDLNDLTGNETKSSTNDKYNVKFNEPIKLNIEPLSGVGEPSIKLNTGKSSNIGSVGKATSESLKESKTWDGFGKFNNVPIDPEKPIVSGPQLSKEELLKEKFKYLRKLEAIEKKGARLSKKYTMDSSLDEMKGEYELIVSEKEKSNSVKFQGRMLMAAVTGLEFLNNRFDPFDFKLDGWSEQINENIDDYDEIFGELHEKYQSKAKMAPELKLLFQLGGSAVMLHMTNSMFKSAMPGMDDIMRQNPELMQQFTQAAVNSMGQSNPGFGNFMNGVMENNNSSQMPPSSGGGMNMNMNVPNRRSEPEIRMSQPPPPPIATKTTRELNTRPDMRAARGQPEKGINVMDSFAKADTQPPRSSRAPSTKRPEMKGPSDINDILSRMKSKKVDFSSSSSSTTKKIKENTSSTISLKDLKEMSNAKMPKSSRRKRSERNTISLDI